MKYKTTIKEIKENAINARSAGCSELKCLLAYHRPNAYTQRILFIERR